MQQQAMSNEQRTYLLEQMALRWQCKATGLTAMLQEQLSYDKSLETRRADAARVAASVTAVLDEEKAYSRTELMRLREETAYALSQLKKCMADLDLHLAV